LKLKIEKLNKIKKYFSYINQNLLCPLIETKKISDHDINDIMKSNKLFVP